MIDEVEKRKGENVLMLQAANRGYSTCYKCGLPWNECKPQKAIMYSTHSGVFAMCKYCWDNSDVDERVHHFRSLYLEQKNRWGHIDYNFSVVEQEILKQSKLV